MFDRAKFWRYTRYTVLTVALLAAGFTLYLDFRVRSEFEGRRFALPARIYARPLELHAGLHIAQIDVVRELQEAGYGQGPREGDSGWFANDNDWLEVAVRPFVFWDGLQPAKRVRVSFDGGAVKAVQDAEGRELPLARLEPLAIGGIYPANNEDRVLVRLSEVPKQMVQALIATEDRNFYAHHGFDLRGIARAAFSFLRLKGLQGGGRGPRRQPESRDGHLAPPGLPRPRPPAAAARLRRSRSALRRPARLHHARPARADRGGARARAQDRAVQQRQDLRRAGPRRRGGGHRHPVGRGAGAGRRTRRALPRLQPRAGRRAPRGLAPEARDLPYGARRSRALHPGHADRRRALRVEEPRRAGLGADELRQDLPRRGSAALRARALLQRRDRAPRDRYRRRESPRDHQATRHRARDAALRFYAPRRGRPLAARSGADVPDHRERRVPHALARDPRGDDPGRTSAQALRARGGAGVRARAHVPDHRCDARSRPRRNRAVAQELGAARDRRRGQDRNHDRAARRLVRGIHRRPARHRVDRLRRQPRGAALRRGRGAAGVGRDDGGARSRAARASQAGRNRERAHRSRERAARGFRLPGGRGAAVRSRLGAYGARSLRFGPGRRGRRSEAAGEELDAAPVWKVKAIKMGPDEDPARIPGDRRRRLRDGEATRARRARSAARSPARARCPH